MSREKHPSFDFYPKDWLSDDKTLMMTFAEKGAYADLLCHCWLNGTIPDDPSQLARLLKCPLSVLNRLWPALRPCFEPAAEGRLIQARLDRERGKKAAYSAEQAERGRKGAASKHGYLDLDDGGERHDTDVASATNTDSKRHNFELAKSNPRGLSPSISLSDPQIGTSGISTRAVPHSEGQGARERLLPDDLDKRAGHFCEWYRFVAYPSHRNGAAYVAKEHVDWEEAKQLCQAYEGPRLKLIAETFLQIPEDREKFLRGKTRTLAMLRSMASAIDERLRSQERSQETR